MYDTRVITLVMNSTEIDSIIKVTNELLWRQAIGYLSSWNMSYPKVTIYREGKKDMLAVYSDASGDRQYNIGAVWYNDRYNFHS